MPQAFFSPFSPLPASLRDNLETRRQKVIELHPEEWHRDPYAEQGIMMPRALSSAYNKLWWSLVYRHQKKGFPSINVITVDQFARLSHQNCAYCGRPPHMAVKDSHGTVIGYRNGIDRIDNNVGYIIGNCAPACWHCNRSKGDMSFAEWSDYLERLASYNTPSPSEEDTPKAVA